VKESGAVISSISDITLRQRDVMVRVAATAGGTYGVGLSHRGKEFSFKTVSLRADRPTDLRIAVPNSIDGVIVATVYDENKNPIAERLLFRQPEHTLKVRIVADRAGYVPGDKVTLRVTTTTDSGKPVGAVVGLTVTDSSVLEMIEKREQAPRLPVMVLLENEVKNLADAHVYLDETNPKAPLATDLLLGTQGWRRFATAGKGSLNGAVTDWRNTAVPGVTVHATNTFTGSIISTVTNERGAYGFPALTAGTYRISASLAGFQSETVAGLRVAHKDFVRQDFRLAAPIVVMAQMAAPPPRAMLGVQGGVLAGNREARLALAAPFELDAIDKLAVVPNAGLLNDAVIGLNLVDDFARKAGPADEVAQARRERFREPNAAVREYAHALRPDWTEGARADFAETVYWNAGVKTDDFTGTAAVSFNLSDSVTSFRVLADAFGRDATLGSSVSEIESVQPLSVEPKIPLQITSGDTVQLPVGVINGTGRELRGGEVVARGPAGIEFTMLGDRPAALRSKERARRFVRLNVKDGFAGLANLTFEAKAGAYRDAVSRTLDIQPAGFPHQISTGGALESNGSRSFEFTLPSDIVRGSLSSSVTVYPTPLASMTDALQSLLREPYGCFEQTSSTSYPMVMAQQYFLTHTGIDPAIVGKARDLLEVSYKKLSSFESPTKGYEWFGADPGHEALTAYGLLQFTDMSQVRTVDKEMLDRTRAWLLSRRDGNGGFSRNARALDSFGGAPADTTNAYIVWALIESGEKGLAKEIASVKASAASTQDSYILALAANVLHASGDHAGARQLMDKLARNQDAGGHVKGAVTSITRSGGEALAIETTALSVLAWMREPVYAPQVANGMRYVV
jgi:hypothetical protein